MTNLIYRTAVFVLLGAVCQQAALAQDGSFTLYSQLKYKQEKRDFCFGFVKPVNERYTGPCDLRYGMLYAGDEWDWFESTTNGTRSVIQDLGSYTWTDQFKVPLVTPRAKLLPGERRQITVDTSGADGLDGAPGKAGEPGTPGADADGVIRRSVPSTAVPNVVPPAKKKNDGKPKVDPIFVKAVVGHMYVIHVVDEMRDFYALFRVDALERGDRCSFSWRIIKAPEATLPTAIKN